MPDVTGEDKSRNYWLRFEDGRSLEIRYLCAGHVVAAFVLLDVTPKKIDQHNQHKTKTELGLEINLRNKFKADEL